jgi:glycerophosphoryl diester phosphodiesterase
MARPYLSHPGPWLVAHRGGSLLAPENTCIAFDQAVALGADVVELDVHLTRDGVVVVFHDEETERLTGSTGSIEERTTTEVGALDAAHGFTLDHGRTFPLRGRGVQVPTLAEVLARYPSLRFSIDAKSEDPALVEALVREVKGAGAVDRVCLGSFFDDQATRLGSLLPEVARFLPQLAATSHVMAAKSGLPAKGLSGDYDLASLPHRLEAMTVVDRPVVEYFHRLGIPVHVWTVNEEADMRELLALGVDGIITDRPDLAAVVMGRVNRSR